MFIVYRTQHKSRIYNGKESLVGFAGLVTYPRKGCSLSTRRISIKRPPLVFVRASTVSLLSFSCNLNGKKHGRKLLRCHGQFHRKLIRLGSVDCNSCRNMSRHLEHY
ncbi:hypothetical protein RB195_006382 [Necator americanus]|uniref:Uncharacterized protein n=1 Tax=Necator americanus TaxID=51031 RepID=A0ABR1BVX5_NECAM